MTSSVKVTVHCGSNKEVVFSVGSSVAVLQDGESTEKPVYDSLVATVYEREKGVGTEPTYGEKAVGLAFNPSGNDAVTVCKRTLAAVIDQMNELRASSDNPEVKRMASIAITEAQSAQMWAVKALTWK